MACAAEEPSAKRQRCDADVLKTLKAFVVNLERRPDRWDRIAKMLREQTPWLDFEQFKASDGTKNPIPKEEICEVWNSERNAYYGDYFMWVHEDPGTPRHGSMWKWAADTPDEDDEEWAFEQEGDAEDFQYIRDAPSFDETRAPTATAEHKTSGEKLRLRLQLKMKGDSLRMSGGERGCAHSHLRLWQAAAARSEPTLALEDDAHFNFQRSGDLGEANGQVFAERLKLALELAPQDFDVIYLGWSGWRGGHHCRWRGESKAEAEGPNFTTAPDAEAPEARHVIRRAEYVWTTVAYVISQKGARKLLEKAKPMDQPVDNFMAWEASQGRLNSYVVLDEGDGDDTWAGGVVDQFDFQGDTDIQKSDGGVQGDNVKDFVA